MRALRDLRLLSLTVALLAAAGLVLLPSAGGAQDAAAADGDSAVTVTGKKGDLDDFSRLEVTVHQTRNLRSQALRVTWTGGEPTDSTDYGHDYLQLMQCWGDSASGPDRTQCTFGTAAVGTLVGHRSERVVAGSQGAFPDPAETEFAAKGFVPFRPVTGERETENASDQTYFSQLTTNEQPLLRTGPDGTGEATFEVQSAPDAPQLGCGALDGGRPRPCWLVIVPRGQHDPDGSEGNSGKLSTSPLSATNWAQRMVVRLDFLQTGRSCPLGQAERSTTGSEMVSQAMTSWQPTLCTTKGATYGYSPVDDAYARSQILRPVTGSSGLAFALAPAVTPEGAAPLVHAPVAVSALVIGYNIEDLGSSTQIPRLRLTPRLVAKMLTSSYQYDLPSSKGLSDVHRGRLSEKNAPSLRQDPEFLEFNPLFKDPKYGPPHLSNPGGLIVPQGSSDYGHMIWRWLQGDKDAREFLQGKPDPWGQVVNPNFRDLDPAAENTFPKSDQTSAKDWAFAPPDTALTTIDYRPYVNDLHAGALQTRRAYNLGKSNWNFQALPPAFEGSPQLPGNRFQLTLTDAASAAQYGLGIAELRNTRGQWTRPDTASLTRAVQGMESGQVEGVLDEDPTRSTDQAYPLTTLTYAIASTGLPNAERKDYAELIHYAAGPGQQPGIGPGLLPPGYAPLPSALRSQANDAADRLLSGAPPGGADGGGSAGAGAGADGSSGAADGGASSAAGAAGGGAASAGQQGAKASASPGAGVGPDGKQAAEAGRTTPQKILGIIRWVLIGVLIAGVVSAIAGPVLLRVAAARSARAAGAAGAAGPKPAPLLEGNSSAS